LNANQMLYLTTTLYIYKYISLINLTFLDFIHGIIQLIKLK